MGKLNDAFCEKLRSAVKQRLQDQRLIKSLVADVLADTGVDGTTVLRRDFDGCSGADWLVEKMIGEYIATGKINL